MVKTAALKAYNSIYKYNFLCISKTFLDFLFLVFTNQPNKVSGSCTNHSLHPNYYYQIVFFKLNHKVEYPLPYQRFVRNFEKSNNGAIKKSY